MRTMRILLTLSTALAVVGCVDDPADPKTWIKKLDDPRDSKEAVRQLVKLHDKAAVAPLIALFKKSHDPEHLKAIASFDDPSSLDTMIDSLDYSEDSFDAASVAATALGELKDPKAVDALIKAVQKPLPVKTRANVAKLEAMKSLAKIKDPRAVDALIKVLSTSAEEQDFFLNKVAAQSLGGFADPKAVPALVRGLFMEGSGATAGANIFQECRTSLIAVGEPAVDQLVKTMQRKNEDVELDASKHDFIPGIIVQKTAMVIGDIRSKKALPALLEQLNKPDEGLKAGAGKGVSEHQSVILALGQIGDPSSVKVLLGVLNDPKRHNKERSAAAQALNFLGDPSALPSLKKLADMKFINEKTKEIDPEAGVLVATAATEYSRLAGADAANVTWQKLPADLEESDAHVTFKNADVRLAVAKECDKDVACYAKYLKDSTASKDEDKVRDTTRGEKAAFMLSRLGKPGLLELAKGVAVKDQLVRQTVLIGIGHVGDKSCTECTEALDKQIEADSTKPPLRHLVLEMRAVRAQLTH